MTSPPQMNFASDNWSGAHIAITEALRQNAEGRATAYGRSTIDLRIESIFNQLFERPVAVFFVATGTAANALSMAYLNKPGGVILAHRNSHMIEDECGAVEFVTGGARICGVHGRFGKMDANVLDVAIRRYKPEFVHSGRPMAVSITQSTESGTVYTLEHIEAISKVCKAHELPLHMDGARFANALARLGCSPADMTWRRGVDILSFGATKNGCWCAEAIIVFTEPEKAIKEMPYMRKRAAHLFSKTRFIAAQFDAYLADDLWLRNARNANDMAERLAKRILTAPKQNCIKQVNGNAHNESNATVGTPRLAWPVETNELFVVMDKKRANELHGTAGIFFYEWIVPDDKGVSESLMLNENTEGLFRLVTSFATTPAEVDAFAEILLN